MRIQFSLVFRVLQSPSEQVFILLSAGIAADTRSRHDCLPLFPCHRSASVVSVFAHMALGFSSSVLHTTQLQACSGIFLFITFHLNSDCMCARTSRDRCAACLYLVFSSSQHQNHLLVVSHSMPKRRPDPAHDLCNSRDELVLLTGSHSPPRAPTATLVRGIEQMLPERCTTWTDFNAQSSVMLSSVSHSTGSASSLSRAVEPFQESFQAPKIFKADARRWLTALGESVSSTSSSAELKAKLVHLCQDVSVDPSPIKVVTCMPQRVLAMFVKYDCFQRETQLPL